jgi:hypothetical protein
VIGSSRTRTPVALNMALAIAAPLVELRVFRERHANAHHDAASELTLGRLPVQDPAAVERSRARLRRDRGLTGAISARDRRGC